MALLGASFQIGRSALAAYQSALAITGQNIANVGNPDYTRLSGRLSTLEGGFALSGVSPGAGVNLSALQRHADEALEARLRAALGARVGAETTYAALSGIENVYNELTDYDLSSALSVFFNSFADVQNEPQEMSPRQLALAQAEAVIRALHYQRDRLIQQAEDLNDGIVRDVERANEIADELAGLNELIVTQEARATGSGAPLRDRRDALLRELAELMDIEVHERDNGSVNVYIGSEPLVEFNRSRGLTVVTELDGGLERASVRFADTQGSVLIRDGRLAAQLTARDTHLVGQVQQLDQLARGLIYEVNRLHSSGRGLVGYTSLTGTYAVADPDAALDGTTADLPFPVENGSFIVHVRDQGGGETITRLIEVDLDGLGTDTTLNDLAQQLDAVPGLSASVTPDQRLHLEAEAGLEFWFSEDSSGALAALGLATFFDGTDAATIEINANLQADQRLLAASLSGALGDGENAGRLATLGQTPSSLLNNLGIQDFHAALVGEVASQASAAQTSYQAADAVYSGLLAQREAVSGVSLDEEAINLTKFERAYQGATRFLQVLDSLTYEVLNLVS